MQKLLRYLSPSLGSGMTLGTWLRVLVDNRFDIEMRYLPRALVITAFSLVNSALRPIELMRFGKAVDSTRLQPPLFVLGAPRSGTTHLLTLLAQDSRFAWPSTYQTHFPHHFLTTERWLSALMRFSTAPTRMTDNVAAGWQQPDEDEFALSFVSGTGNTIGSLFNRQFVDDSDPGNVGQLEGKALERWKSGALWFCRKLTFLQGKPLLLKSPMHCTRIPLLLELFPDARFVLIIRNPFDVLRSRIQARQTIARSLSLRGGRVVDAKAVVRWYAQFWQRYFETRDLIPVGRLVEVRHEELVRQPMNQLRQVYDGLGLSGFTQAEAALEAFIDRTSAYRQNRHEELGDELKQYIVELCGFLFDEWGYDTQ